MLIRSLPVRKPLFLQYWRCWKVMAWRLNYLLSDESGWALDWGQVLEFADLGKLSLPHRRLNTYSLNGFGGSAIHWNGCASDITRCSGTQKNCDVGYFIGLCQSAQRYHRRDVLTHLIDGLAGGAGSMLQQSVDPLCICPAGTHCVNQNAVGCNFIGKCLGQSTWA